MVTKRIEEEWKDTEEQSEFGAGRSGLRQLLEKRFNKNLETHVVFVDLRTAYYTMPRKKMFELLW